MFSVIARNKEDQKEKYEVAGSFSTKLEASNWASVNRNRFIANGNWILEVQDDSTGLVVSDETSPDYLA